MLSFYMRLLAHGLGTWSALLFGIVASGQTPPDFTGHWRLQTDSGMQRQLDVEQNGRSLVVKTTVTNSKGNRRLEVKYQIGDPAITYTGLDGDEFHSSVHWDGSALVFDIIEHEDGREISETTLWSLA
jgi:hypothetical protein